MPRSLMLKPCESYSSERPAVDCSDWLDLFVRILRKAAVKTPTLKEYRPDGGSYEKSLVTARTNKAAQPAVSERQKANEKEHERQAKPRTDVE